MVMGVAAAQPVSGMSAKMPGIGLSAAVAIAALIIERIEWLAFGMAPLETLVIAIILGASLRSLLSLSERSAPGIHFSSKTLLEVAVVLLGASISSAALVGVGPMMLTAIMLLVVASLAAGYVIGRSLGLPPRMALLIACGTSICGNSAIAAIAPVLGSKQRDVTSAITFTAAVGLGAVLLLPFLQRPLQLNSAHFGVFTGLVVYAVPQVFAATAGAGAAAAHAAMLVKLCRILMLGPVIFGLSIAKHMHSRDKAGAARQPLALGRLVPWFVIGFALMIAARSLGLLSPSTILLCNHLTSALTCIAMAALGLSVDVRTLSEASGRVLLTAIVALIVLAAASLLVVRLLVV